MAAPITRYARSGEVHLAYQVIGDGPRDVVLSLDWASHLEVLWEQPFVQELLTALARFSRVLWFDMRGIGLSDALVCARSTGGLDGRRRRGDGRRRLRARFA